MGEFLTFTATGSPQVVSRALKHTNPGTIPLIDAGPERTEVAIAAEPPDHPEPQTLAGVFDRFVRQVQSRFQGAST